MEHLYIDFSVESLWNQLLTVTLSRRKVLVTNTCTFENGIYSQAQDLLQWRMSYVSGGQGLAVELTDEEAVGDS